MQKGFAPVIALIVIAVVAAVAGGGYYFLKLKTPEPKVCTADAKICPDGSSVGRIGPNCEFAPCPKPLPSSPPSVGTSNWKTYTKLGYEIKYPPSFNLVEIIYGSPNPSKEYDSIVLSDMKLDSTGLPKTENILAEESLGLARGKTIYNGFLVKIWPIPTSTYKMIDKSKFTRVDINGIEGLKDEDLTRIGKYENTDINIYLSHQSGKIYEISAVFNSSKKEYLVLFNKILSTFKFLDQNQVEIKKERCVVYPKSEDVEKYKLKTVPKSYCAICGDRTCDYIEGCLPSSPITTDCAGGLSCP